MKTSCITNVLKKLTVPVVFYGMLWLGSSAYANVNGDITSIKSDQANVICTASGTPIDFKISLSGTYNMVSVGANLLSAPEIRMVVNGTVASATLYSLSQYTLAGLARTDCIFRYITKPGDMAQPLKIYGSPTIPYIFNWSNWEIRNTLTTSNAVWKFNALLSVGAPDEVYDLDLVKANITIRTLTFDDSHSPSSIAATENATWRVTTVNPITSTVVDFYVWTPGSNVVQIGTVPNQTALLVSMATGATQVDVPIRGLAIGTTDIYLQRTADYANNGTVGVTNYIKRTINVTAPPQPTVRVVFNNGTDNVTVDEDKSASAGTFHIELSEAFSNDVAVRIDTLPVAQSNVTFASSPFIVTIPATFLVSSDVNFRAPDGTVASYGAGVTLTPVVTNAIAAAYYSRIRPGTVYVRNVKPVIAQPIAKTVYRGVAALFSCTVTDASQVDMDAGMTYTWDFGDGTITNVTSAMGAVNHTFTTPVTGTGTKTVSVLATDKDGSPSDPVSFTVTVIQPIPKPSVRVVPSAFEYNETSTNNTGVLNLVLSETFTEDVWVSLATTPAGQSNIVFGSTNAIRIPSGSLTNVVGIKFSIPDGTLLSETAGIDIIPTVTNDLAKAYYTDLQSTTVYVSNVRPKIIKPSLASLPASYATIPMSTPFGMQYAVEDVPADAATMAVTWEFDNGVTQITRTGTGLTGWVYPVFPSMGDWTVTVRAQDKDGGVADEVQFTVTVVAPLPLPTVSIIPPAGPLDETSTPSTGQIIVHLSETFTNTVTVQLNVTPANSTLNGTLTLATNRVLIAKGQQDVVVRFSAKDGTILSRDTGFIVTPVVLNTPQAVAYFTETVPGLIQLLNVAPVIMTPVAAPTTGTAVYTIPQGTAYTYYWDVSDVPADLTTDPTYGMKVTWYFGDGSSQTLTGGSGSVAHTYTAIGDMIVRVVALDKDGGRNEVQFKITVAPSKSVNVTPIGPNLEANYWGAAGLGNGKVSSPEARSSANLNNVYFFKYDPGVSSATLMAVPYKAGPSGYIPTTYDANGNVETPDPRRSTLYDSFFYVWVGTDQGLAAQNLVPATAGPTVVVTLPTSTTGTGGASTSVDIRDIQAIFSREWRVADNMGDINLDGIPDKIATRYNLPALASGTAGTGTGTGTVGTPIDLINVASYNGDNDYLPGAASGGGGVIGGMSNVFATVGDPFTAILEVRGFHPGLNNAQYGSDDDFGPGETKGDEPRVGDQQGTDPTKWDTDGDGFPDGWEYYFWYNARMKHMTGSRYDPLNVAVGTVIDYNAIIVAFDPLVAATDAGTGAAVNRDMDNDGLSDIEELTIGTNPINWDTDGDGMCDGWEVMRGLNPNDSRDGLNPTMNNPDGDYMAIASVARQFVTSVRGITTNTYLATGADVGTNTGVFTTWYRYGDTNAAFAVGRPAALTAGEIVTSVIATNALIMHSQVYNEFGYDPRTAWTDQVNPVLFPNRFPDPVKGAAPNTKPFTSVDEYLLMKFMSENRMTYVTGSASYTAGASIGDGNAAVKTRDWSAFSTHPLTPDSDATAALSDGMPDGWELYVACQKGTRVMEISPWSALDGAQDIEPLAPLGDGLNNLREFAGTDSCAAYANPALYGAGLATVTITRPAGDVNWINKFWPTDPWNKDTDGDGMDDGKENAFVYGATPVVDNGTPCTPGGGLNPCSVDTDRDSLPDAWENQFTGTMPTAAPYSITNGMDGTVSDFDKDWDADGLLNYQEYWVQAVRGFRYDITGTNTVNRFGAPGLAMDIASQPADLFTQVTNVWDVARKTWGVNGPTLYVLLPVGPSKLYVSTDPRDPDTDGDAMDDFYEMFHGLNPILGDPTLVKGDRIRSAYKRNGRTTIDYGSANFGNDWGVALPMDFMSYPWLAGMPEADPDADGLRNLEEKLQPNTAAPPYSNTDPTPIWMTDSSNPDSLTARFYKYGGMFFWPATLQVPMSYKMFSFEMNEGYDTDNDGLSDKAEMMQTATTQSDPRDHDDPMRRQAIWFSGTNSAAQTLGAFAADAWAFRSFTVELWVRPENVTNNQVLIERPIIYGPSDLSTTGEVVRVNFRVGVEADGRVYAMFQNAGLHDSHTGVVKAYGRTLTANRWVHLTARMDGAAGQFDLLVNGLVETTVPTILIPANGVVNTLMTPGSLVPNYVAVTPGVLVLGAANINPGADTPSWADYEQFFKGFIDEVRVWDGARSNDEILTDYTKRYTKTQLLANRRAVRESQSAGGSRAIGATLPLQPELMFYYNFDNLFSADSTASVAQVPRGFNDSQVSINRPAGTVVGWWAALATHSTVYADYGYIPWIENGVDHLPIFGGFVVVGSNTVFRDTDTVRNSIYYSETHSGTNATENLFPNSNDPYGFWYKTSLDVLTLAGAGIKVAADLLPLGGAWAKQAVDMWDNGGPSGVWAETGVDSDSDGLPDWWETYVAGTLGTNLNWYTLLADGMTAGERYMRDIANGATMTNPSGINGVVQTSDVDGDGIPDWWENLYNLNPYDSLGDNGAMGDPDHDGLSNYAEYLISERYKFRLSRPNKFRTNANQVESDYFQKQGALYLGEMFSDHDFMEDSWEDEYDPYFVSRFVYDPQIDNDEDGWSNWAECRFGASALRSDPSLGMHLNPEGISIKDFPVPVIETRLTYNGLRPIGNLMIFAYSSPSMDGVPDAIYRVQTVGGGLTANTKQLGFWGAKKIKGVLSPGSVQPATILITFTDILPDPIYTVGAYWPIASRQVQSIFDVADGTSGSDGKRGILKATHANGLVIDVGTINYLTGEYELDLSLIKGWVLRDYSYDPTGGVLLPRLTSDNAYLSVAYSATQIATWPKTLYLSDAEVPTAARPSLGYVKEGTNYFFALIDLNNNATWDAGEPCGVSDGFGVEIGWDRNVVNIDLTDYAPNYVRMTMNPAVRSEDVLFNGVAAGGGAPGTQGIETRMRIQRKYINGSLAVSQRTVLDKTIQTSRTYVHDGDFLEMGTPGLDWGFPGDVAANVLSATYQVYRNNDAVNAVLTFTNTFDSVRAKAASTYPINGAYVYSSRPTFKWTMPQEYTAFTLEIRKGSSSGTVVYNSGTVMAPVHDADGNCVWTAPIYAGDRIMSTGQIFSSNTPYAWRVIAMNPKFYDTVTGAVWSDWKMFRLDVNSPLDSSGYGAIQARVKYYGPATNLLSNRVKVQVFRNGGFAGVPEAEYTLTTSDVTAMLNPAATNVNALLRGLVVSSVAGDYYVRAYIDHNQNGARDVWESWGYANYYGITDKPYDPLPITVEFKPVIPVYDIHIEDADSDQDWYPDAWEYEQNPSGDFLNLTGPSSASNPDTEVNPFLSVTTNLGRIGLSQFSSSLTLMSSDADGDGLSDMTELILGTNPRAASTAGDGFADGEKVSLGLSPFDFLTLNVTGLSLSDAYSQVQWKVDVRKAADASLSLLSLTAAPVAHYEVQYKALLSDAEWTPVASGTVTLDGVQPDKDTSVGSIGQYTSAQGFFRVQLKP